MNCVALAMSPGFSLPEAIACVPPGKTWNVTWQMVMSQDEPRCMPDRESLPSKG